jgi:hypothetical protein
MALHRALRAAIVIAVILVFTFLADENPDREGWLFLVSLSVAALIAVSCSRAGSASAPLNARNPKATR